MNIVIASSAEYAQYAKVLLLSLFENEKEPINIYYYHIDEMDEVLYQMKCLAESFGNKLIDMNVKEKLATYFHHTDVYAWDNAVWYRFLCINDLKNVCDRVLILGVDVLIKNTIADFYHRTFAGQKCIALVKDMWMESESQYVFEARERFKRTEGYGNSDVCLIDLKSIAENVSFERITEMGHLRDFHYMDQDVLNYCYSEIVEVVSDIKYNYMPYAADNMYGYEITEELFEEAHIIHYAGVDKPWRNYRGRRCDVFWKEYAQKVLDSKLVSEKASRQLLRAANELKQERKKLLDNYTLLQHIILEFGEKNGKLFETMEKCGMRNIAIFGGGVLGKTLLHFIRDKVNVKMIIDSNAKFKESEIGVPTNTLDVLQSDIDVDTVIVALSYDIASVVKMIKNSNEEVNVISIGELLDLK